MVTHCNHEEADMRIFMYAKHDAAERNKVITINANDTDILVIAVSVEKERMRGKHGNVCLELSDVFMKLS